MNWKDAWSTPGDFVGPNGEGSGMLFLHQIPDGHPKQIPTTLLDPKFQSVRDSYPYLHDPSAVIWLDSVLEHNKIPDSIWEEPDDFWNWDLLKYSIWKRTEEQTEMFKHISQQTKENTGC